MNSSYDYIVVGAGLAGACAAFHLAREGPTLVLEGRRAANGASRTSAGLANPIMGRRAKLTWRADEALAALENLLEAAGCARLFRRTGVLRPVDSIEQAESFRQAARNHPAHADWLAPSDVQRSHPDVAAAHGALMVRTGGAVDFRAMISALLDVARMNGAAIIDGTPVQSWSESPAGASVLTTSGTNYGCRTVIFACGGGFKEIPVLRNLNLHTIKGQVVEIAKPRLTGPLPCLSGTGYIAPCGEKLVLGSSYEHTFDNLEANPLETAEILRKTGRMLPAIEGAVPDHVDTGVRVSVPGRQRPAVGPVPGAGNVWVFTGLASRGLLTAPLIAEDLSRYLNDPDLIPDELLPTV